MTAVPYEEDNEEYWEPEDETAPLPGRRRPQLFNRKSAALIAMITCAAGFYAGIRVEKGQLASSTGGRSGFSLPSTGRTGSTSGARSGSAGGFPAGGRFPGFGSGSGSPAIGTIASVNGSTIYVTETSGNTVKVTLSSTTKVTKTHGVSKHALRPGDSVVIQGLKGSNGRLSATSVSDSGASSTGSTTGTSNRGSSAVSSLFGSGNGG